MLNNSSPGQAVYEPFQVGDTLIAAETCGRICLAIELDPVYVDVAILRWQVFTATGDAVGDGRSFAASRWRGTTREARRRIPRPAAEADGDPPSRRQPRQARLEPRRAGAARGAARLSRASLGGGDGRVAPGGEDAARHGRAHHRRPCGAGRLLPGLGRWVEAERKLQETPTIFKTPSGYVQQSPWLGIANKQLELMGRYMTELGMTPAARSRVASNDPRLALPPTITFTTIYEDKPMAAEELSRRNDEIARRMGNDQ